MYRNILVCLDNSEHANAGARLALEAARASGSRVTGCHVYAARLHNSRFQEMEEGLPDRYRHESELRSTREVHDTLIASGLKIISDSCTAVFQAMARASGIEAGGVSREGKNFEELVDEVSEGGYDLAVLGAFGLGITGTSRIGSVAERVARRVRADALIARADWDGKGVVAAVDGSPCSFGALQRAIELSAVFGHEVEAVSAFDPDFHHSAFRSLAGVLSEEAGRLFRFKEQERLHEEIIDKGLARIYRGHLDAAERLAASMGVRIRTTLLSGKASDELIKHVRAKKPLMLFVGRTGAHASPGLDIGATAENCLREVPCHLLLSSLECSPPVGKGSPAWNEEALEVLSRIPQMARGVVRSMVEDAARKRGLTEVTAELMRSVRKDMEG